MSQTTNTCPHHQPIVTSQAHRPSLTFLDPAPEEVSCREEAVTQYKVPANPSQSIPTHTAIEANRAMRNRTYQPILSQNHIPTILNIPIPSTHQPLTHPHLTPSPHTPQSTPTNLNQPQPPQPQEECSTVYSQQCPPAYSAPRHQKHPNTFNTNQKLN